MKEMKTLNGYEVVDAKAREDIAVLQESSGGGTIDAIEIPVNYDPEAEFCEFDFSVEPGIYYIHISDSDNNFNQLHKFIPKIPTWIGGASYHHVVLYYDASVREMVVSMGYNSNVSKVFCAIASSIQDFLDDIYAENYYFNNLTIKVYKVM